MPDPSTRVAITPTRPRDVSGAVRAKRANTAQRPGAPPTDAAGAGSGLRWPPTADDLDAVEVVVLNVDPAPASPARPALVPTTRPQCEARGMPLGVATTALPDIVDLDDSDEDAFATEEVLESSRRLRSSSAPSRVRRYVWASAAAAIMAAAAYLLLSPDLLEVSTVRSLVATWQPSNAATSQTGVATVPSDGTEVSLARGAEIAAHSQESSDVADNRVTEPAASTTSPGGVIARPEPTTPVRTSDPAVRGTAAEGALGDRATRLVEASSSAATREPASLITARPPFNAAETARVDPAPPPPSPQTVASNLTGAAVLPEVRAPLAPPPVPAVASASPPPVVRPAAPTVSEDVRIQGVLRRYEAAYERLDARAAQAVWPGVDVRALSRAFDGLESQSVRLGSCEFDVRGSEARAACLGSTTYVPRIGSRAPRTELRSWTFRLEKAGENWQIVTAEIR